MKPLRALIALAGFVLVLSGPAGAQSEDDTEFLRLLDTTRAGEQAPNIEFLDGQGRTDNLRSHQGKAIVVNFWATWCAPCIAEMPALDRLNRTIRNSGGEVIAINTDFAPEDGPAWLADNGIRSLEPYYDSTGNAYFDAGGAGLPYSLIIGSNGLVVAEVFGDANWSTPATIDLLNSL